MNELEQVPKSRQFTLTNPQTESADVVGHKPFYISRQDALQEFDRETDAQKQSEVELPALSSTTQVYLANARLLLKNAEVALAQNLIRQVLNESPFHRHALQLMGQSYQQSNDFEKASRCFKELNRVYQDEKSLFWLADSYYRAGLDDRALKGYMDLLSQVTNEDQDLFEIYKNVGNIHCRAGDFDAAEEYYNKAYTLNPDSDVLFVNYGTLEIQKNDIAKAKERFKQALEVNIKNDKAWVGIALVHNQFGDHELAWANLENALDVNPYNKTAIQLSVQWAYRDGALKNVVGRLQEYLAQENHDTEISFLLAQVFCSLSDFKLAKLELERNLLWSPDHKASADLYQQLKAYFKQLEAVRAGSR